MQPLRPLVASLTRFDICFMYGLHGVVALRVPVCSGRRRRRRAGSRHDRDALRHDNRKGKGKQRAGAAGKGGVVKAGVPKFHVMITHYEVRIVCIHI